MRAISQYPEPARIPESEHGIGRDQVSSAALKVLDQLTDAGFEAYMVGGGVRDLILGLRPKDFDIATSATPAEVKEVFGRSCRLIGRRFRLAHVRVGREVLEVATFRAHQPDDEADEDPDNQEEFHSEDDWREPMVASVEDDDVVDESEGDGAWSASEEGVDIDDGDHDSADADEAAAEAEQADAADDDAEEAPAARPKRRTRKRAAFDDESGELETVDGRIVRDNVYGSFPEDAMRRDFTINALYFDARDGTVVDFCGGVADLRDGVLRLIGDPATRYREDPVRMLRALRFASKLDFKLEAETSSAIYECAHLIESTPPARLYEETLKLLLSGAAVRAYEMLRQYGLFTHLFPDTDACVVEDEWSSEAKLVALALRNTDKRIKQHKPVTPAFLFASLLWPAMREDAAACESQGLSPLQAIETAGADVLARQAGQVSLPKRFSMVTREIWSMQARLMKDHGRRAIGLISQPKFRAAYDLLLLRAEAGEDVGERARWWTALQDAEGDEQQRISEQRVAGGARSGNRQRRNNAPNGSSRRSRDPDAQPDSNESTGLPSGGDQYKMPHPLTKSRRQKGPRQEGRGGGQGGGQGNQQGNGQQRRRKGRNSGQGGGQGDGQPRAPRNNDSGESQRAASAPAGEPQTGPARPQAAGGEAQGAGEQGEGRRRHPRRRRRRRPGQGGAEGGGQAAPAQPPSAS